MDNRKQVWPTIIGVTFFAIFGFWFWRPFEAAHQAFTFNMSLIREQ